MHKLIVNHKDLAGKDLHVAVLLTGALLLNALLQILERHLNIQGSKSRAMH